MHPDEQLMMKVKSGNLDSMSELFQRYHRKIFNYFLRNVYDKELSEDLTQNVFERAMKYRTSYKDSFPFKAWIYKIANNVKYDHYREKKVPIAKIELLDSIQSYAMNPESQMEENEQITKLKSAMKKLTDEQRNIIWLTKYEQMKYAQVAEIVGCTETAMKTKIHRAMKSLKLIYFQMESI